MTLRKCPCCKETVGADSIECPRCGENFRSAQMRRLMIWALAVAAVLWLVNHFVVKAYRGGSPASQLIGADGEMLRNGWSLLRERAYRAYPEGRDERHALTEVQPDSERLDTLEQFSGWHSGPAFSRHARMPYSAGKNGMQACRLNAIPA